MKHIAALLCIALLAIGVQSIQADTSILPEAPSQYKKVCGSCHMAYPPVLLPAIAWENILDTAECHFGERVTMDSFEVKKIRRYLTRNAADKTSHKVAQNVAASLGGVVTDRITSVPYIQKKHANVTSASLKNCASCHSGASQGRFEGARIRR